jgi:hypothetical protein
MEYHYSFDDDTPGDIVEALNEDKSIILWDIDASGSGVMIKIDYRGITIKKEENGTNFGGISNGSEGIE